MIKFMVINGMKTEKKQTLSIGQPNNGHLTNKRLVHEHPSHHTFGIIVTSWKPMFRGKSVLHIDNNTWRISENKLVSQHIILLMRHIFVVVQNEI